VLTTRLFTLRLTSIKSECPVTHRQHSRSLIDFRCKARDDDQQRHCRLCEGWLSWYPDLCCRQAWGISTAYAFKLFPPKEEFFVAALEGCFESIRSDLADGADASVDQTPGGLLFATGGAIAALISNRDLLMLQVHAQSAGDDCHSPANPGLTCPGLTVRRSGFSGPAGMNSNRREPFAATGSAWEPSLGSRSEPDRPQPLALFNWRSRWLGI
jgi:hypothetical protein